MNVMAQILIGSLSGAVIGSLITYLILKRIGTSDTPQPELTSDLLQRTIRSVSMIYRQSPVR